MYVIWVSMLLLWWLIWKFLYINCFVYIWLVKEKVDVLRRFVIGGGLKLFLLFLVEVEFLSGMGDRFIFSGLVLGYDIEEGINFYKMCLKFYFLYIKECISIIILRLYEVLCMIGIIYRNKLKYI